MSAVWNRDYKFL